VLEGWSERVRYEPRLSEERRSDLLAGWHDAVRRTRTDTPR
jgi:glycerol kinase